MRMSRIRLWNENMPSRSKDKDRVSGRVKTASLFHPAGSFRGLHEGQSDSLGEHEQGLPAEPESEPARLGEPPAQRHHPPGRGGALSCVTEKHGWAGANPTTKMLRSLYRRPCVDYEGLKNTVEFWLPARGKYHPHRRRRISSPAEVSPRWYAGIEAVPIPEPVRDVMWIGVYTGMRLDEIESLRWERVDPKTKTGDVL